MKFLVLMLSLVVTGAVLAGAQTISASGVAGGVLGPIPASRQAVGVFPGGRAVTGMPYSAQQTTEHVQTLADGTHIQQNSQQTMLYRDSLGRTRTERTLAPPPGAAAGFAGPGFIEIFDPVSGNRYTLDPRNHTARQRAAPPPPPPPAPGSAARVIAPDGRVAAPAGRLSPYASPAPAAQTERPRPQITHESLGAQTMEGVMVQGERRTMVYPEGFFGNDRPITVVNETWMSPELNMVVLSKNSDPRSGESTTRLTNISRAEPDPSLFQVPPDYQVLNNNR
jgi:hypothetical protein